MGCRGKWCSIIHQSTLHPILKPWWGREEGQLVQDFVRQPYCNWVVALCSKGLHSPMWGGSGTGGEGVGGWVGSFAWPSLRLRFVFTWPSLRLCRRFSFASLRLRRLRVAFESPSRRPRLAVDRPSLRLRVPSLRLRLRFAFAAPALRHRVAFASSSLTLRFAVAVSLSPSPCLSNDSRTSCCSVAGNTSKNTSAAHQRRVSGTSAAHQRLISGYIFTRICTSANRAASRFH